MDHVASECAEARSSSCANLGVACSATALLRQDASSNNQGMTAWGAIVQKGIWERFLITVPSLGANRPSSVTTRSVQERRHDQGYIEHEAYRENYCGTRLALLFCSEMPFGKQTRNGGDFNDQLY